MNEEFGSSAVSYTTASPENVNAQPAISLLDGPVDANTVRNFRNRLFSTVRELERARDWLTSPMASGIKRGLALWALGSHAEALPILEEQRDNPAIANCIARSLLELGRHDDADAMLTDRLTDPEQASTSLNVAARRGSSESLQKALDDVRGILTPADVRYFEGRIQELQFEAEAAIACYDEALALQENHAEALFRLAVNVDLRGEDEEARELYERALMIPPVNEACVINLGILY
jgi:DNA-directed RNA polymerase subunit alpha